MKLRISGERANGTFRERTGGLADIKFVKDDGDWKVDGLSYFVSKPSFAAEPQRSDPGKLHTAEGREIAASSPTRTAVS